MICEKCGIKMDKIKTDYQYKESGLDNVFIKGISAYRCPSCNNLYPIIPSIKKIHELIANALVNKPSVLLGRELVFLRKQLRIKAKDIADIMGVHKVTVSRWENENSPISISHDRFIRWLYRTSLLKSKCEIVIPEILRLRNQYGQERIVEDLLNMCEWISATDVNLKSVRKQTTPFNISIPASESPGPLFTQ